MTFEERKLWVVGLNSESLSRVQTEDVVSDNSVVSQVSDSHISITSFGNHPVKLFVAHRKKMRLSIN